MPKPTNGPCGKCGSPRTAEFFFSYSRPGKPNWRPRMQCKKCHRFNMKAKKAAKRIASPLRVAQTDLRYHLKQRFGLALEEYHAKFEAQLGRCAICETQCRRETLPGATKGREGGSSRMHVDHDHVRGNLRSLLCASCNLGLGKFKDDPRLLEKAARYLSLHAEGVLDAI